MTHQDLHDTLGRLHVDVDAAEVHGWLCGALCVRAVLDTPEWMRGPELRPAHDETLEALNSPEFEFAPLLPGDDADLTERVEALAAWCGGFLYGIAAGGAGIRTGDVGEFLGDLAEIARAELEPGREAATGEVDFVELYEFVRAGTQLAWDELADLRTARTPAETVH